MTSLVGVVIIRIENKTEPRYDDSFSGGSIIVEKKLAPGNTGYAQTYPRVNINKCVHKTNGVLNSSRSKHPVHWYAMFSFGS